MNMKTSGIIHDVRHLPWVRFWGAKKCNDAITADCEIVHMPEKVVQLYKEFENFVESQQFQKVDSVEKELESFALQVTWDGEMNPKHVWDVQIYQSTSSLSFRTD